MELSFDERMLLVPGVHEVSLEVVRDHFGTFQRSDRRPKLMAKLEQYLEALRRAGVGASVIIGGSFVMACIDEPDDIDLVLVLPAGWDMDADLKPYQYNLVSKKRIDKTYGFDVFVVRANSTEEDRWTRFFQDVNPKWSELFHWPDDLRKGILRVKL